LTDANADSLQFQSHNGAIAANDGTRRPTRESRVSIPQWCDCCIIVVRPVERVIEFQSHNGAIAAGLTSGKKQLKNLFQSHNGAIAAL